MASGEKFFSPLAIRSLVPPGASPNHQHLLVAIYLVMPWCELGAPYP